MRKVFAFVLVLFLFSLQMVFGSPLSDDTELGGSARIAPFDSELHPDKVEFTPGGEGIRLLVVRINKGKETPVDGIPFTANGSANLLDCVPGNTVAITATLQSPHWKIQNANATYTLSTSAPCGGALKMIFEEASPAGQVMAIWQIAYLGKQKLASEVGLQFWTQQISFQFPESGNYYDYEAVHITEGHHWDVVGHEFGHAIYDQAKIGVFGGGSHAIDQCYSGALALSEGWASYFSAWLSVDLNDADAKFEYMVPRRAPLRFETIPGDVCAGQTNEWRVTGFFWDLNDTPNDGESLQEPFAKTFHALSGAMVSDTAAAATRLMRAGIDSEELNRAWRLNFLRPL